jgi:putative ABC transport system permease protein
MAQSGSKGSAVRSIRALLLRTAGIFRRGTGERELSSEMDSHLQMHIDDNLRAGMSPSQARREAIMKLGGIEQTKENYRERRGLPLLETLFQDVRFAARSLRKNPGFTCIAVLTLALGLGANTAIFSMVNALLLHPYNFRELDQLTKVWEDRGFDEGIDARRISAPDADEVRTRAQVFEALATYRCHDFNLNTAADVQPVRGCEVSANFFAVLGVSPWVGRSFNPEEEQRGADQVAVVSHGFWQRRFGSDPGLLGRVIQLNGAKYNVVGIMPQGFDYPVPMDLWVPLALSPAEKVERSKLSLEALGRLKPAVGVAQAQAALDGLSQHLRQEFPVPNGNRRVTLLPLRKELYTFTLPLFLLLQAAAVFVLLLACANLTNLLFARVLGRQKEVAVRAALGADRWRLARLFITETLLLSCIACVVAILVSFWSVNLLRTSISPSWTMWVPGWDGIQLDRTVLWFTVLLAVLVGVLFGFVAALHSRRAEPFATLKEAGRGPMLGGQGRLRSALLVAQVMFALILLVCAGLITDAFTRLAEVYRGFQPANVLRIEISLPKNAYSSQVEISSFYERLLRGASALPGASAAAIVSNSPASNVDNETTPFTIEGRPALKASDAPSADLQISSPDYFQELHIPLVAGRVYSESDNANSARVAVISRTMAKHFWPRGDELGQRIKIGPPDSSEPWMTVVGVVEDVRQNWWNPAKRPAIYEPFLQLPRRSMVFLLRGNAEPESYVPDVREAVRQIDDQIALTGVNTLEAEITDSVAIVRIMGVLMAIFGSVALTLASLGVYGVLAEGVARRVPEIGIRLALGAEPRDVMRLVFGQALKLTGIGLVIGLPIAFAVNRAMASLIFGIVSVNLLVLAEFTVLLILAAVAAAYVPARRAMRVDPMVALRYE